MQRHEILFTIKHNENLEKYQRTFWGRVDRMVVFLQLFLSTLIFADIAGTVYYGAFMATLTISAFIYQPAKKAWMAAQQIVRYSHLKVNQSNLSDNELKAQFEQVTTLDSEVLGSFYQPAYNRACIQLDSDETFIQKLTIIETIAAWLGGDLPRK